MSVDLSNPEVRSLQKAVLDKENPTKWFLLKYLYNPTHPTSLIPLASGVEPAIPQIRQHLATCDDELVYGYADVQGKGLIIAYMVEGIGGVRRARAVVHSRAVASLFPDYSAIVTISKAQELTDQLITEELGLDQQYLQQAQSRSHAPSQAAVDPETVAPPAQHVQPTAVPASIALDQRADSTASGSASAHTAPTNIQPSRSVTPPMAAVQDQQHSGTPDHRDSTGISRPSASASRSSSWSRPLPVPPGPATGSPTRQSNEHHGQPPAYTDGTRQDALSPTSMAPSSTNALENSHSPSVMPTSLGPPVDINHTSGRSSPRRGAGIQAAPEYEGRTESSGAEASAPVAREQGIDDTKATETPASTAQTPLVTPNLERDLALATAHLPETPVGPSKPAERSSPEQNRTPSGNTAPLPHAGPLHLQTTSPNNVHSPSSSPQMQNTATKIQPDRPLDPKGIASSDFFPDQRHRKASLTSRFGSLGHAFGRGGSSSPKSSIRGPNSPTTPVAHSNSIAEECADGSTPNTATPTEKDHKSPGSPTLSRFMNSALVKNFGRKISGVGSNPASPRSPSNPGQANGHAPDDGDIPPPLPPKDDLPTSPGAGASNNYTPYVPPPSQSPSQQASTAVTTSMPTPGQDKRNYIGTQALSSGSGSGDRPTSAGRGGGVSPSPSAKIALAAASQKSVRSEMEIQERFRRDLELREQERAREKEKEKEEISRELDGDGGDAGKVIDGDVGEDAESEAGLPYDRPSPEVAAADKVEPLVTEATPHQGLPSSEVAGSGVEQRMTELDLAEGGAAGAGAAVVAGSMATVAPDQTQAAEGATMQEATSNVRIVQQEEGISALSTIGEDSSREGQVQEDEAGSRRLREEEEAADRREHEQEAKEAAERRLQDEKEAEDQRVAEETRLKAEREAEEARLKAEREAEEQRLREKEVEEARLKAEKEAEEARLKAEREAEAQRLREEKEAEEKRLREEKEAEERRRREQIRGEMMKGKQGGGVMLTGWVTVQTTKSLTWRRRHFSLLSHELQLFKSEGDSKPIQTISLGPGAKVSHTYEESQVQGSFKVTSSSDGEDFFLFTDGPEDREVVLEGLAMSIGA